MNGVLFLLRQRFRLFLSRIAEEEAAKWRNAGVRIKAKPL